MNQNWSFQWDGRGVSNRFANPEPASYRGQSTEDKEAQKQAHNCIRVSCLAENYNLDSFFFFLVDTF